jgi:hypothetical protein
MDGWAHLELELERVGAAAAGGRSGRWSTRSAPSGRESRAERGAETRLLAAAGGALALPLLPRERRVKGKRARSPLSWTPGRSLLASCPIFLSKFAFTSRALLLLLVILIFFICKNYINLLIIINNSIKIPKIIK